MAPHPFPGPTLLLSFWGMHLDLERESTPGDTTAPRTGRTSNAAEGATALSLARLFFMRGFVMLPLYRCSPPVCLLVLFSMPGVWVLLLGSRSPFRRYHRHRAPWGVLVYVLKKKRDVKSELRIELLGTWRAKFEIFFLFVEWALIGARPSQFRKLGNSILFS